jgi:hypothetical protein
MKFAASDWEQQMSDRETLENRRLREEISAAQGLTRKRSFHPDNPWTFMDIHGRRRGRFALSVVGGTVTAGEHA